MHQLNSHFGCNSSAGLTVFAFTSIIPSTSTSSTSKPICNTGNVHVLAIIVADTVDQRPKWEQDCICPTPKAFCKIYGNTLDILCHISDNNFAFNGKQVTVQMRKLLERKNINTCTKIVPWRGCAGWILTHNSSRMPNTPNSLTASNWES